MTHLDVTHHDVTHHDVTHLAVTHPAEAQDTGFSRSPAYTANDTPEITERIDSDLRHVVATVRQGDPHLRALVLTGGFARGEGTVLAGVPQNDYDFVAIRGVGRSHRSYAVMARGLERRLGLHIDLAPVPAWRLHWTAPSIFWYETALRGRTIWGEELLHHLSTREPEALRRTEGLRLLVNRAAGLLLATGPRDAHAVRIQAAKGLLAALDATMLSRGVFAPSQTERWSQSAALRDEAPSQRAAWYDWAYRFKRDPLAAGERGPDAAWRAAREAILAALPAALAHARLGSLPAYARADRLVERLTYGLRAHRVAGARRLVLNPTGRIRVATLQLLQATPGRAVRDEDAARCLAGIAAAGPDPLATLAGLRAATLQ